MTVFRFWYRDITHTRHLVRDPKRGKTKSKKTKKTSILGENEGGVYTRTAIGVLKCTNAGYASKTKSTTSQKRTRVGGRCWAPALNQNPAAVREGGAQPGKKQLCPVPTPVMGDQGCICYPKFGTNVTGNARKTHIWFCYRCCSNQKKHRWISPEGIYVRCPPQGIRVCCVPPVCCRCYRKGCFFTTGDTAVNVYWRAIILRSTEYSVVFGWVSKTCICWGFHTGDASPISVTTKKTVIHHPLQLPVCYRYWWRLPAETAVPINDWKALPEKRQSWPFSATLAKRGNLDPNLNLDLIKFKRFWYFRRHVCCWVLKNNSSAT